MSENSDDQQQFFLNGRRLSEMKVFQLQAELESRGLPTSGNKNQLIHRLENFLREHQEQEAQIHLEQQEQQQPEPSLQEWNVQQILAERVEDGQHQLLVQWGPSWEDRANLNCDQRLEQFKAGREDEETDDDDDNEENQMEEAILPVDQPVQLQQHINEPAQPGPKMRKNKGDRKGQKQRRRKKEYQQRMMSGKGASSATPY